ncbi:hypothetical protein CRH09_25790 [Nocardia terpenica]|uniref:Uncharacterized protein n=1 Tax=Nocardia terpenica TaxID=455432 RepID=A0A291RP89_9NOCA|nr:hypothetical protein CRH09_25790 [Nocardia terpenica]
MSVGISGVGGNGRGGEDAGAVGSWGALELWGGGDVIEVERVLARADAARELGRVEEARRILGEALVVAPEDPALLERMADIAYRLGRIDEAVRVAGAALAADPGRTDAHLTAALAFEVRGRTEASMRHARTAVAQAPHDTGVQLTVAGLLARSPERTDADAEQARDLVAQAIERSPWSAGAQLSAARVYLVLRDDAAARRHIAAGLELDPVHADLLALQARTEFEQPLSPTRARAVGILRGLLGANPGHAEARRLLSIITWRALLRLAGWVWAYVLVLVLASEWLGHGGLHLVGRLSFWVIPLAWIGVFRRLRRQLPRRYLRRRLLSRPEALLALPILILAGLIVDIGTALLYSDTIAAPRGGYVLLLFGVAGAALGHFLLFCAWLRRADGEEDRGNSFDYAGLGTITVLAFALLVGIPAAALAPWSHQPAAMWVYVAVVGLVAGTLVLEVLVVAIIARADYELRRILAVLVPVALLLAAGTWWGTHHLTADHFRSDGRVVTDSAGRSGAVGGGDDRVDEAGQRGVQLVGAQPGIGLTVLDDALGDTRLAQNLEVVGGGGFVDAVVEQAASHRRARIAEAAHHFQPHGILEGTEYRLHGADRVGLHGRFRVHDDLPHYRFDGNRTEGYGC